MSTPPRPRPGRAWGIVLLAGVLALVAAGALFFAPGFRLSAPTAFGEVLGAELLPGEYALYVTPSDRWGAIECTGVVPGEQFGLRPDMTQQGVVLPQRWDALGSFETALWGDVHITCDGPVADGRFAVGPPVSFLETAGSAALGVFGFTLVVVGLLLRARRSRRPVA